jgi:hypothetical protein
VFHLKRKKTPTHEPLHAQNDETNGNIEFLQLSVVAAESGAAVILAVLSLDGHLSQTPPVY